MADNRNKMIYGRDVVGKRRPDKSAVALEYTLHDKAPKVIASGKGYLAEKIIDKANEEDIPVHKDEKLAKSLENIEIGEYIPPELYQAVFRFAVTMVPRCVKQILKKTETDVDDIKFFVLHQANVRILELIAKRLKVDIDKFPMNLDRYGNTSSASIPILLDELNRNHLLERGDKIILSGFGGGLTWGAMLIEW